MHTDGFENEFWDEHKWESHLEEVEKKSEQLRRFISSDQKGTTPRWITLLKESLSEDDAVDAFIEEELLLDEAYFPEEADEWDDEDEFEEDDFLFGSNENEPFDFDEDDDFESGEEWKALSEEYTLSDYGSLNNLELYNKARIFAIDIIKWVESAPTNARPKMLNEFVSDGLKIGAKLAGGYSFGFEQDYLGGNIAYTKRALWYANNALHYLQELKSFKGLNAELYSDFHCRLFELRNDIGIYIQELRDRFRYGFDS